MAGLLPSGLPELVGDDESLARVLTQTGHYSSTTVKASAFVPAPDGTKSVARHSGEPLDELWQLAQEYLGPDARIHGAAICVTKDVRALALDVRAAEPPRRHANIVGWPIESDAELQKSRWKELALVIASNSRLILKRD